MRNFFGMGANVHNIELEQKLSRLSNDIDVLYTFINKHTALLRAIAYMHHTLFIGNEEIDEIINKKLAYYGQYSIIDYKELIGLVDLSIQNPSNKGKDND